MRIRPTIAAIAAGAAAMALSAETSDAEVNFKGQRLTILISSRPGGSTDGMGRLLGEELPKHLPGQPTVIYKNVPAGGGVKAMNYFYSKAKPDGLTVLVGSGSALRPGTIRKKTSKYDPRRFIMIGALPAPGGVAIIREEHLARLKDKSKKPVIMGGTHGRRMSSHLAVWGPEYLGWNVRWVVGYRGSSAMQLAYERKETQLYITYETLGLKEAQAEGKHVVVMQVGMAQGDKFVPRKDYPNAPILSNLIKSKLKGAELSAFEAWEAMVQVGKWYALPPKTPANIVKVYYKAWDKMVATPSWRDKALKRWSPVFTTATGQEMSKVVQRLANISDADLNVIERLMKKVGIPTGVKRNKVVKAAIVAIKKGGKRISFKTGDKTHTVKVSGRGTDILMNGDFVSRKKLKPGMVCEFTYPGNKKTAKSIVCG